MNLDQMLADAAPGGLRTAEVDAALLAMVDETRALSRPSRRRRWLVGAAVVPVVIGGAAAVGAVPTSWIPWTTQSGSTCRMDFSVDAAGPDGETNMLPQSIDRRRQAKLLSDARAFLAGLDVQAIDEAAAIESWKAEQRQIEANGLDADNLTGDDLEITAVGGVVWQRMNAYLSDLGYDMRVTKGSDRFLLVGAQAWRCGK